jgi:hypothetical protein
MCCAFVLSLFPASSDLNYMFQRKYAHCNPCTLYAALRGSARWRSARCVLIKLDCLNFEITVPNYYSSISSQFSWCRVLQLVRLWGQTVSGGGEPFCLYVRSSRMGPPWHRDGCKGPAITHQRTVEIFHATKGPHLPHEVPGRPRKLHRRCTY